MLSSSHHFHMLTSGGGGLWWHQMWSCPACRAWAGVEVRLLRLQVASRVVRRLQHADIEAKQIWLKRADFPKAISRRSLRTTRSSAFV
jgi:hypothetical protein